MKKLLLFAVAAFALSACDHKSPTGLTGNTIIISGAQTILTVNSSVQLAATVYDQNGRIVPNASVTWVSLNPSVASVTSTGLVTGVSVGSATIEARDGSAKTSQVVVQVDADPCTTPLSLTVGQVRQISGPAAVSCVTLAPTTGATDFLFVTANATPDMDNIASYAVSASQGASGSIVSSTTLSTPLAALATPQAPDYASPVEANIREQERAFVPQIARARNSAALNVIPIEPSTAAAPTEGSTITIHVPNVNASDLCNSFTDVQAEVKKVSQHAVIAQDVNAPSGGFTTQDFTDIANEWETLIYPTDTAYFGAESDRNGDGHVTILYTGEVNRATSAGSSSFIAGFFWGGDLVKKSEYQQIGRSCPQTNEQEIFYMLVPDPNGTINGNARSVTLVRQNTRGTLAHEFQHMINQGSRLLNPAVDSSEVVWLNESLSHFAEEIVGRRLRGFGDFQNLTYANVNPNAAQQDDYQAFFRQNLTRFRPWMQRPDTASPISLKARNQLAPRGVGWMFIRYLTDQYSNNNAKAFLRHVVAGPDIGIRNLTQWTGGVQFDDMLRGFLVSQYTDELNIPGLAAVYTVPSWNLRDVMSNVPAVGGAYPLLVVTLPTSVTTQSISGSGNYFRLTRNSASPATTFRMQALGGGQISNSGVRVYVVRLN